MKFPLVTRAVAVAKRVWSKLNEPMSVVSSGGRGGWFQIIGDTVTGAWQQGVRTGDAREVLAFSAVFACVTGIANDIAKLRIMQMEKGSSGIGEELSSEDAEFMRVLRKPNHYQNRIQFILVWIISKLLYGNTYVLKLRDRSKRVEQMYVLDPTRVAVMVTASGDVYYQLSRDDLSGVKEPLVIPASEIIHDITNPLFHPLIGVSPIYACALSATMGSRIQKNSTKFFDNMSRPSGMLTSKLTIQDETAARLKEEWEKNFSAENIGRLAVLGDGLRYEAMTIPANDAQLIEQLKWTVEDVARCFHYPLYKLGTETPPNSSIQALHQAYYNDCLQPYIESAELCLDEGLELGDEYYTQFDLDNLMRMDAEARYESYSKGVQAGWVKPNEVRAKEDLQPVVGGDACYLQQQNYSLEALAKRDAKEDPFATQAPARRSSDAPALPTPKPAEEDEDEATTLAHEFIIGLEVENVGA